MEGAGKKNNLDQHKLTREQFTGTIESSHSIFCRFKRVTKALNSVIVSTDRTPQLPQVTVSFHLDGYALPFTYVTLQREI